MIRSLCLATVLFYRRRIAGRGPFACVRCTFANQESCSAYGQRMLQEHTAAVALPRIARRLARCRHLSLYRLPEGGLGWGQGYDVVVEAGEAATLQRLDRVLAADDEGAPVRAAVRNGALIVRAASRTEHPALRLARQREDLPWIRAAGPVQKLLSRRFRTRGALVLAGIGGCGALAAAGLAEAALAVAVLAAAPLLSALAAWRLRRRLEDCEVLSALDASEMHSA